MSPETFLCFFSYPILPGPIPATSQLQSILAGTELGIRGAANLGIEGYHRPGR